MNDLTTILPMVLLIVFIAIRMPVAFALAGAGVVGIVLQVGFGSTGSALGGLPFSTASAYELTLIPTFIVMGLLVSHAGLLGGVFDVLMRVTRKLPGGLGIASVAICTFMGGITGSSAADAAAMGRMCVGEMSRRGYDKTYAAAVVAAAATVAILIPPSIGMVVYGVLTQESIGDLLLAGIVPGLLTALSYCALIVFLARKPGYGEVSRRSDEAAVLLSGTNAVRSLGGSETALRHTTKIGLEQAFGIGAGILLFTVVVGGLYGGIFTATEAGAIGALMALVLAVSYLLVKPRSREEQTIGRAEDVTTRMLAALHESGRLTAMVFALIVGAAIFTQFLVLAGVPANFTSWVTSLDVPPILILILFLVGVLILGMFVDGLSILLVVTPIVFPVIQSLGYDAVWFGVLLLKGTEIGLLTPPMGLNVYVVAGLYPDLKVESIFRRLFPFVIMEIGVLAVLVAFPGLSLFIPSLVAGG